MGRAETIELGVWLLVLALLLTSCVILDNYIPSLGLGFLTYKEREVE